MVRPRERTRERPKEMQREKKRKRDRENEGKEGETRETRERERLDSWLGQDKRVAVSPVLFSQSAHAPPPIAAEYSESAAVDAVRDCLVSRELPLTPRRFFPFLSGKERLTHSCRWHLNAGRDCLGVSEQQGISRVDRHSLRPSPFFELRNDTRQKRGRNTFSQESSLETHTRSLL